MSETPVVPVDPPPAAGAAWTRRVNALQVPLNREWAERFAGPRAPAPPAWRRHPRLAGYRFVSEPLAELDAPETDPERYETVCRALAEASAGGDTIAARVVLQHVVPHLAVMAWGSWLRGGQWARQGRVASAERHDTFDAMVSTVWLSLVTGDALRGDVGLRRRLLHDADYWVLQRPRRRAARERVAVETWHQQRCVVADLAGRAAAADRPAGEELLEVVSDAVARGLGLRDAQVLADLGFGSTARFAFYAVTAAARVDPDGVSTRGIRYRRAAALQRVRDLPIEAA